MEGDPDVRIAFFICMKHFRNDQYRSRRTMTQACVLIQAADATAGPKFNSRP
jgi:hypothetical protein